MKITESMLDAIEAVKGKRNPAYWDNRCRRYMETQEKLKKDVKKRKKG
tara:strand:+ start:582 stop:725 length:144 start_codon:yes stop_codon:yes gene_type:complete